MTTFEIALDGGEAQHRARDSRAQGRRQGDRRRRREKDVLRWVEINKYRFKRDAKSVTELWETNDL